MCCSKETIYKLDIENSKCYIYNNKIQKDMVSQYYKNNKIRMNPLHNITNITNAIEYMFESGDLIPFTQNYSPADTWMCGDIEIVKKNEFDDCVYEVFITLDKFEIKQKEMNDKKGSKKKERPSPSESATLYEIGFIKKGNDGNKYIIVENKNGIKRWKKYMNNTKN